VTYVTENLAAGTGGAFTIAEALGMWNDEACTFMFRSQSRVTDSRSRLCHQFYIFSLDAGGLERNQRTRYFAPF
jgi:hypothetical protein